MLLPGQQEDVFKTETRHSKPDGYGMLLTNGTGTGKTYSGLGLIKRFARLGRTNTLIVVPDDKVASDWIRSAKDLGLTVTQLQNTKDPGKGITITTYANLGQNDALAKRQWDLVVPDESHNLMKSGDATVTDALRSLRALTYHPDGVLHRVDMENRPLVDRIKQLGETQKQLERSAHHPGVREQYLKNSEELSDAINELQQRRNEMQTRFDEAQGAKRPRLLFLSATPFAYEKNIEWAQGYLFQYPKTESEGYNSGRGRDRFMMQHFGYRMRHNKLTEPGPDVDRGMMQRDFNTWLKREGALSARMLDVDADYDRRFMLIDSALGNRIDEALDHLRDQANKRTEGKVTIEASKEKAAWRHLSDQIGDQFDYLSRMYLLEAIKTEASIPIVQQHLDLGRKVVVFHDFKRGGGFNPFKIDLEELTRFMPPSDKSAFTSVVNAFNQTFSDLVNANWNDLKSPIEQYRTAFGDKALIVNGDEKQRDNLARFAKFQDDASGPQVMLVQSAKNAGWSGHDTTGKYQRVLLNLGLPVAPTTAIQQEGRVYRTGQVSNAIFRYMNTGTNWERFAFASKIAQRASTAENLGMGEDARALKDSFISAFLASDNYAPGHEGEGTGGKALDRMAAAAPTPFARAKSFYWATEKKTAQTKAREGTDYFATPEPLGLKMVQWADQRGGEAALEPSAGHGAIARWMPENIAKTFIEPSNTLRAKLALSADAATSKIVGGNFEDLHPVNKYDTIVMNPPFGSGGKTAVEHLEKAADHLRDGGRIVALIPEGPAADKRLEAWLHATDDKGRSLRPDLHLSAVLHLPTSTFERAATKVATRILVLDKQGDPTLAKQMPATIHRDLSDLGSVRELFDKIENMDLPGRLKPQQEQAKPQGARTDQQPTAPRPASIAGAPPAPSDNPDIVEHTTQKGKVLRGVIRKDLTQAQAQAVDKYTFRKGGGFFIREEHLSKLPPKPTGGAQYAVREGEGQPRQITPEQRQAILEAGQRAMRAAGLPESVALRLVDRLGRGGAEADARYTRGLIEMALDTPAEQLPGKLFHEIVHGVMDPELGVLTPQERLTLLAQGDRWLRQGDNAERLRRMGYEGLEMREEAVARMGEEALARGMQPSTLYQRIVNFLGRIRNWFQGMGFQTSRDVFDRMMSGERAGRAVPVEREPGAMLHEQPHTYHSWREMEPPEKTVKAYKLFRIDQRQPGKLFPLFVQANEPVAMGKWLKASAGEPGKTAGKVKSKLGDLAYRPGWHSGDLPVATHIGGKSSPELRAPDVRPPNHVWAEVEHPADVDWQSVANGRARMTKAGVPDAKTAHVTDQVPEGGHYRYKTNPNMTGNWIISGGMKVNRVLSDSEVHAINSAAGVADLPRRAPRLDGDTSEGGQYSLRSYAQRTAGKKADEAKKITDEIHTLFSPTSRGAAAEGMEAVVRRRSSLLARSSNQTLHRLDHFARDIDRLPEADQLDITHRVETGQTQRTPELQAAMTALNAEQNRWLKMLQSIGQLKHVLNSDDYMGRIYSNYKEWKAGQPAPTMTEAERRAMATGVGRVPLRGSGNMLKARTFDTLQDAMAAGLVPVTTNPIKMQILKLREMQRYYHGTRMADEIKAAGLAQWVPAGLEKKATEKGLAPLNDTMFRPRIPGGKVGAFGRVEPGNCMRPSRRRGSSTTTCRKAWRETA